MNSLKNILKALISFSLLIYLVHLAEPQKILQVLNRIWTDGGVSYLLMSVAVFLIALLVFSFRWQILLRGYGINVSTRLLFKLYLIGLFFNNFLPTGIGGDVLRIYHLIQETGNRTIGFASVMTERLLGISGTLLLTIAALILLRDQFGNLVPLFTAIALIAAVVVFFILIFNDRFMEILQRITKRITVFRFGERLMKFVDALRFYKDSKQIYLKILFVSLCGQLLIIVMNFLLARALGIGVTVSYFFLVVPITFLLTMMPSINGLGFREGGYVFLLGKVGVAQAAAISLSFLAIIIPMIVSIAGGILFICQKKIPKKEEIKVVQKNF